MNKLVLQYNKLEKLGNNKHSSLLGPFTICEENEVLKIRSQRERERGREREREGERERERG